MLVNLCHIRKFDEEIHRMSSTLNLDSKLPLRLFPLRSSENELLILSIRLATWGDYSSGWSSFGETNKKPDWEIFVSISLSKCIYPQEPSVIEALNHGEECQNGTTVPSSPNGIKKRKKIRRWRTILWKVLSFQL